MKKLIKNRNIVSKPTIQGMTLYFLLSNDKLDENELTESKPICFDVSTPTSSDISVYETSSNSQPLFRCNDFVKNEVFKCFMKIMSNLNII